MTRSSEFYHPQVESSGFTQGDGLVAPLDIVGVIGALFLISPWGRSSLLETTPGPQIFGRIRKGEEPMLVQKLGPEPTVESFDEYIFGRLSEA